MSAARRANVVLLLLAPSLLCAFFGCARGVGIGWREHVLMRSREIWRAVCEVAGGVHSLTERGRSFFLSFPCVFHPLLTPNAPPGTSMIPGGAGAGGRAGSAGLARSWGVGGADDVSRCRPLDLLA